MMRIMVTGSNGQLGQELLSSYLLVDMSYMPLLSQSWILQTPHR